MADDSRLSTTTSVADWLARDELLKRELGFVGAVAEISRDAVGLVLELNQEEWRTKLREKAANANSDWDVLINRFLNTTIPATALTLDKPWPPRTYVPLPEPFRRKSIVRVERVPLASS